MKKNTIIIISVLFFAFMAAVASGGDDGLKVYFLDIGQGDSIFIETGNGIQILVDGGPDNTVIQELSEVMPFWDRTIDFIVLTHPDHDHVGGLPEVLKRYKVSGIIETGIECEKAECLVWQDLKKKENATIILARLGDSVIFDENTKIIFFNPFESVAGEKVSKANNTSLVAKLIYGEHSILLTGDIEKQIEEKLVLAGIDIDSDYLKLAHHGSKTSTADEFLDKVSPEIAFISLGLDNNYGHPHQEVIERLEKRNIKYYRTDASGTIELFCKLDSGCRVKNNERN